LQLDSGWPPAFAALLSQCWHQDSVQRPSAEDISARLAQMLESEKNPAAAKGNGVFRRVSMSVFGLNKR